MVVKMKGPMQAIQSHLKASGRFRAVTVGEPFKPPEGLHAAIMLESYAIPEVTLNSTIERRTVIIRLYVAAIEESREAIEFAMDDAVSEIIEDLLGDIELAGVEVAPVGLTVRFGFQTIGQKIYRIADLSLPVTIYDSAALSR